jgi:hypothetical protein
MTKPTNDKKIIEEILKGFKSQENSSIPHKTIVSNIVNSKKLIRKPIKL